MLPPLPEPMRFVGFPDGDRIYVTKSDLGALAVYLATERVFIEAAKACLEVAP